MKVLWSPSALADLEDAWAWVAQDDPDAAGRLIARLLQAVEQLSTSIVDGPVCTLRSGAEVRKWRVGAYAVYYQRTGEAFRVVRVYHQRRRPIVVP
ncbi:MAG: type II toxin-antitoxin system RelE/ParE family toxin [Alphaproteobacteria bacterium]|nr:type II toxin-antitoxin system RelE/ParE family toxin [Alphaproteobacteria bacterium]